MFKIIQKYFFWAPLITVLLFSIPVTTFSAVIQNSFTYECVDSNGVYGNCTFDDLIAATVNFIDKITILVLELTVFIIAYAGFQYMTSGGNVSQRASATKMLLSVVKGIAIILCAWLIVTLIANTLLKPDIPVILENK